VTNKTRQLQQVPRLTINWLAIKVIRQKFVILSAVSAEVTSELEKRRLLRKVLGF